MKKKKTVKKLSLNETEKLLKDKTILFAMWDCENKNHYLYQSIYLPMKRVFGNVVLYDTKKKNVEYGPYLMKKKLIEKIGREKPDFVLFSVWGCGEFESIDLPEEINKASPKTKIVSLLGDDDRDFEISSRFYAPLIDYNLVAQVHYVPHFEKEGNRAFPFFSIDTEHFKPLNLKKKYDVSFIGAPIGPRIELIRFLIKNGIKVNIWGKNWLGYPEFKDYYRGTLDDGEYLKIISESKINLSPSKNMHGEPHFKGRVFEFGACKSFCLVDYFSGYLRFLEENKEIVFVKDNNDLLKKIKYYLKHEKEREEIASRAYNKIVKNYDLVEDLKRIFGVILQEEGSFVRKSLPELTEKIKVISKKDIRKGFSYVNDKLKDSNYIGFKENEFKPHKYKNYFQAYALEKTGKNISCCDYYACFSEGENYLRFRPERAIRVIRKADFDGLLNLDQVMVRKEYFLNNFEKFKRIFDSKVIDFINEKDVAFIDIPLTKIQRLNQNNLKVIRGIDSEMLDKIFQLNFVIRLYVMMRNKKYIFNPYFYKLIIIPLLNRNISILRYLFNAIFNENNWMKLKGLN